MTDRCSVCRKKLYFFNKKYKESGQVVCKRCRFLIYAKEWKYCPVCGSKAKFGPIQGEGMLADYNWIRCERCSAEWWIGEAEEGKTIEFVYRPPGGWKVEERNKFFFECFPESELPDTEYEIITEIRCGARGRMGYWDLSQWWAAKGLARRAQLYEKFGMSEREAIECYDKALRIYPNNPSIWCGKGKLLQKMGKRAKAVECFDKALAKGFVKFVDRHGNKRVGSPAQVREWKKIDIGMQNDFRDLSPREFEEFVAELFTRMGYQVELTPYVKDYGADVVARKGKGRVLIQVKKYEPRHHVGARDVQRALGSRWKYRANKSILITTSDFTKEAKKQSEGAPIQLWNRELLYEKIDRYILSETS